VLGCEISESAIKSISRREKSDGYSNNGFYTYFLMFTMTKSASVQSHGQACSTEGHDIYIYIYVYIYILYVASKARSRGMSHIKLNVDFTYR
jgi:hypothetical protein